MLEKVRQTIEKYNMFGHGDRVVVAVSGGPDSLALLYILMELKHNWSLKLSVAHYNHLLRPEAADEAFFVTSLAEKLGLPVYVGEGDVARYAGEQGLSVQVAARELRYRYLESVVAETKSQKLALAHQLDDQAETMVMHFLRGPSPRGLSGIPPVRGKIVRPLIEISRQEIEEFLERKQLKPVIDASNYKTVYLRNRIRLELMPLLQQYNPNLNLRLARAAELFRAEDDWLEEETHRQWLGICFRKQERISIEYEGYQRLPVAVKRRLLRRCFGELTGKNRDIGFEQVDRVYRWLQRPVPGKLLEWPGGIVVSFAGEYITVAKKKPAISGNDFSFQLPGPGSVSLPEGRITVERMDDVNSGDVKNSDEKVVLVDGDKVTFPLTIRNRRPGDRFFPLGVKGSKKLKDFFIDIKLPQKIRNQVPVVLSANGEIVWVAGLRLDERYKITQDTEKVLRFSYVKDDLGDEIV